MAAERILFGDFDLDATNFELHRGRMRVKLERIPMELLILLARNNGRLVQRGEVVETIWGKGHFFEIDSAINTAIRKLRLALGDHAEQPTFIETVPGRGYRFLAAGSNHSTPLDARALYSKGLHFWNRKTPDSYVEAIRLYQKAIDIDPDYPLPYLGLAKTWILLGIHGIRPSLEVYPRARATVAKALELDPSLAEAHAVMGDIVKGYDWDWSGAETHYLRALNLDPACALAHQWYANLLSTIGRHDEAIRHAIEARALDPLSVGSVSFVSFTLLRARRYSEALSESESALTLEPNSPLANFFLGRVFVALNRFQEAAQVCSRAVEHSQGASIYLSALAHAYAASGDLTRASEILATLQHRAQEHYISPLDLAIVHMALDQPDAALEHLELAVRERVMRLTELPMPTFDKLRGHERFQALLFRLALRGE
jgi:DNA-binding winged helix-turn-helix (wHTH) protein